jgi:pyridoxamine 5'-phosphate oxidase
MVTDDPEVRFAAAFTAALAKEGPEASRCVVATCSLDGQPSARVVYHRPGTTGRVRFFTNYESQKGVELAHNPKLAVVFQWPALGQQLRVTGVARRVSAADSDAYFYARPRQSQLAAIVSSQSRPIASILELRAEHEARWTSLGEGSLTRPAHWGGYEVEPTQFEFWSQGTSRLHEREQYLRTGSGWERRCLAP